jgi:hypothetical protein
MHTNLKKRRSGVLRLLALVVMFSLGTAGATAKTVETSISAEEPDRLVPLKFKIALDENIYSKGALTGDTFEAHLTSDLRYRNALIASAGTKVLGHIRELTPSKTIVESAKTRKDRFRRHSTMVLQFDQIMENEDVLLAIAGMAVEQISVFNNDGKMREIKVGPAGELLKATSLDSFQVPALGVPLPESLVAFPGHFQIKLFSGDQLTVEAMAHTDDLASLSVSAKVIMRKKRQAGQSQAQ